MPRRKRELPDSYIMYTRPATSNYPTSVIMYYSFTYYKLFDVLLLCAIIWWFSNYIHVTGIVFREIHEHYVCIGNVLIILQCSSPTFLVINVKLRKTIKRSLGVDKVQLLIVKEIRWCADRVHSLLKYLPKYPQTDWLQVWFLRTSWQQHKTHWLPVVRQTTHVQNSYFVRTKIKPLPCSLLCWYL